MVTEWRAVDATAFREAVWAVERESFRPGDAIEAFERVLAGGANDDVPKGYRIERHDMNPAGVRFEVHRVADGRCIDSVRVRRWAGRWTVQRSATAGVPVEPSDAQASALALRMAAEAAERGNDGFTP